LVLQYILGGLVAFLVSAYVFTKGSFGNKTLAVKGFLVFGVLTAFWELSSFFQRTAPTTEASAFFYYLIILTSSLSQPAYLFTVLNIKQEKKEAILVFIPAIVRLITFLFIDIQFTWTDFGWNYSLAFSGFALELGTFIYLGYFAASILLLIMLTRSARSTVLKQKYLILLVSFTIFQAVGFTVTNYMLVTDPTFPPIGGILQLLTFIFIGLALSLKEPHMPLSAGASSNSFSNVYSSFLMVLYNTTTYSNLGETSFKFMDFLKKSKIEHLTSINSDRIAFKRTKDLDLVQLINQNLKFLETEKNDELTDKYLRVLNAAESRIGTNFETVITENKDFLLKSDLIYGIADGKYLNLIESDQSLDGLTDVEICLKIYKRLLLVAANKLNPQALQKKIALYQTTRTIKTTKYGEVSIEETKKTILQFPKDQRLFSIIESFNPLVSWVYAKVLTNTSEDNVSTLAILRQVLKLNREHAIRLRVYPTLLELLAAKIPIKEIEQMYHDYLESVIEQTSGELKQVRTRLLEAERLSAIGRTTAMVGHDLRNPLQVIINTLYLGKSKLDLIPMQTDKGDVESIFNKIESQGLYMNKIVTDHQDFSRPVSFSPSKTNIKNVIDEVLQSVVIPKNVKIDNNIATNAPKVMIDGSSMKRVFSNLILNACQAMPDGGTITIQVQIADGEAIVSIADTGIGIPDNSVSKIFDPFFTTKAQGQGLGLSICKKFVEANKGTIEVESQEGKGTTFKVKLPLK
jgi:signal transduction histidine kinase